MIVEKNSVLYNTLIPITNNPK